MDMHQLSARLRQIENSPRTSIFESLGQGDQYFRTWERDIHSVLCEVALQPDQIQQLFKSIETGAGRSMLGKAGDAVKGASDKISDAWFNKFGGMLQSSGPVQAFDQKFEEIKASIAKKNPELAAKLAKYGEFAKNNPNIHKFLLAIAGSAAAALGVAVAGGVGAGALAVGTGTGIAVGILNIADRLLQGQKASTAIGRGATTGAVAGLAAGVTAKIADMVKAGFHSELIDTIGKNKIMKGTFDNNGQWSFVTGRADDVRAASKAFDVGDWQTFSTLVSKMRTPEYLQALDASREVIKQAATHYKETAGVIKTLAQIGSAVAGGAASAATAQQPPVKESLNRNQLNELFGITGNKVDASTLQKAWVKAGSPTDSEEVAKILQGAGVDPAVISKAYTDMSLPEPAGKVEPAMDTPADATGDTKPINTKEVLDLILKLDPAKQQEVLAYLKK